MNVQAGWYCTYPNVEKQGTEGMEILALSFFFFSANESGNTNTILKSSTVPFNPDYFNLDSPEELYPSNQNGKGFAHLWLICFSCALPSAEATFFLHSFSRKPTYPSISDVLPLILAGFRKLSLFHHLFYFDILFKEL